MERQHIQYDPEPIGFRDHADRRYYYHTRTLLRIDFYADRAQQHGTYLNVCIETPIYERLENFCKDAGHTKTVAVERALISYFDEYEEMKKKLKELESNQDK